MNSILLHRWLGDSIAVEAMPVSYGLTVSYRGADLGSPPGERAPGAASGLASGAVAGSYRQGHAEEPAEPTPVLVRVLNEEVGGEAGVATLFERVTRARQRLSGGPAPRLLKTLGRGGRVLVSVEEYVVGTPLTALLEPSPGTRTPLPSAIALALGHGLLPLWSTLGSLTPPRVDPGRVLVEASGRVRVLPDYHEETSRQEVGAALLHFDDVVAYCSPEEVQGREPGERSGMFYLGLLLHEMLAGEHPIRRPGVSVFQVLSGLFQQDLPSLRQSCSGLHPAVVAFVDRCLARDPARRFASWRDLAADLAGLQALVELTGAAEVAAFFRSHLTGHPRSILPAVVVALPGAASVSAGAASVSASASLRSTGTPGDDYHVVALPAASTGEEREAPVVPFVLDPDAIYPGRDARPMLVVSAALAVDARPVTRAELERFLLVTRRETPAYLLSAGAASDEDAVTSVPVEVAEAYARWAGKRLPTAVEWFEALVALGSERLGAGEVWEWTASPSPHGGHVVCRGRWRDRPGTTPHPTHQSFATAAAPDLGFRCVSDRGWVSRVRAWLKS